MANDKKIIKKNDSFPIPVVPGTPPSGDSSENESLYFKYIILEISVNSKVADNLCGKFWNVVK